MYQVVKRDGKVVDFDRARGVDKAELSSRERRRVMWKLRKALSYRGDKDGSARSERPPFEARPVYRYGALHRVWHV